MSIRMILYGNVKDGMTDAYRDAATPMTSAAREEEGTTTYKWFLSEDGHFVNEDVYTDEAAFFAHFGAATERGAVDAFLGTMDLEGVMVLDPINDEMAEALAAFGATEYTMIEGF